MAFDITGALSRIKRAIPDLYTPTEQQWDDSGTEGAARGDEIPLDQNIAGPFDPSATLDPSQVVDQRNLRYPAGTEGVGYVGGAPGGGGGINETWLASQPQWVSPEEADAAPRGPAAPPPMPSINWDDSSNVDAAPRGYETPPENPTIVGYTQDGRQVWDVGDLDPNKPYVTRFSDGAVKPYAPLSTGMQGGPPSMPQWEDPVDTPRGPVTGSIIDPLAGERDAYKGLLSRTRASLIGEMAPTVSPGPLLDGFFTDLESETSPLNMRGITALAQNNPTAIVDWVVGNAYDAISETNPQVSDLFIGTLQANKEKLPLQAQIAIDVALGRPDGARNIFVEMSRLAMVNPESLPEDVFNFVKEFQVVQDKVSPLVPSTIGTPVAQSPEQLERFVRNLNQVSREIPGQNAVQAILFPELQKAVRQAITTYNEFTGEEQNSVAALKDGLRARGAPEDMMLLNLREETVAFLKYGSKELSTLSMETLARALMIRPQDIDPRGRRLGVQALREEYEAGLADDAMKHWLALGLSAPQIDALRKGLLGGVNHEMPYYMSAMAQGDQEKLERERQAREWVKSGGNPDEMPTRFYGLSNDFYLSVGMQDPLRIETLMSFKPGVNVPNPVHFLADVVANGGKWFSNVSAQGRHDVTEEYISDPNFDPHKVSSVLRTGIAGALTHGLFGGTGDPAVQWDWDNDSPVISSEADMQRQLSLAQRSWNPDYAPGSPKRIEFSKLMSGLSENVVRELSNNNYGLIYGYSFDENNQITQPQLDVFLTEFREKRRSSPNLSDDEVALWVLQKMRTAEDFLYSVTLDTFNLLDLPAVNYDMFDLGFGVTKGVIRGVTGAEHTTDATVKMFGTSNRLKNTLDFITRHSNEITKPTDPATVQALTDRAAELTEALEATGRVVDETKRVRMQQELDEIARIQNLPEGATTTIQTDIYQPTNYFGSPENGDGLSNWLKNNRVTKSLTTVKSEETRPFGELVAGTDESLRARLAPSNVAKGRVTEPAVRAQAVQETVTAADHLGNIITGAAGVLSKPISEIRAATRMVLEEMQTAFKAGRAVDWIRESGIAANLTEDMWRTMEITNALDLTKVRTLSDKVQIAATPEEFLNLRRGVKGDSKDLIFESPAHYLSALRDELSAEIGTDILRRYGVKLDDVGLAMKLQNAINGSMSWFFLENPSYLIRNMVSDLMVGFTQGQIINGPGSRIARGRFTALSGFSDPYKHVIIREGGLTRGIGESQFERKKFMGGLRRMFPGGIPLVNSVFPFVSFRRLSSGLEDRRWTNIYTRSYSRFMAGSQMALAQALQTDPLIVKLAETNPEFVNKLVKSLTSSTLGEDIVPLINVAGRHVVTPVSTEEMARLRGIYTGGFQPDIWSRLDAIANDPAISPQVAKSELSDIENNILATGHKAVQEYGMLSEDFDRMVQIYDDVYKQAISIGIAPKDAREASQSVVRFVSSVVPYVRQYTTELKDMLEDPMLYKNAVFGLVDTPLDELGDVLHIRSGRGAQLSQFLISQEVEDKLRAISTLVSMGETLEGTKAPVIRKAAEKARQQLNDLMMEVSHRQGRALTRRATRSGQVTASEISKFTKRNASQVTWEERRAQFPEFVNFTMADESIDMDRRLDYVLAEYTALYGYENAAANRNSQILRMVRKTATDVTPGQMKDAWDRAVDRGWVSLIPDEVSKGVVRAAMPAKIDNEAVVVKFDELFRTLKPISEAVAEQNMLKNADRIKAMVALVERSQREFLNDIVKTARESQTNGLLPSQREIMQQAEEMPFTPQVAQPGQGPLIQGHQITPQDSEAIKLRFISWAENRTQLWQAEMANAYNMLVAPLGLARMPSSHGDAATVVGRAAGHMAPTEFTGFVADNLPIRQLLRELGDDIAIQTGQSWNASRRWRELIFDEPMLAEGIELPIEDIIDYIKNPAGRVEAADQMKGLTRPLFIMDKEYVAPTGVVPGKVIPAWVDGRKFTTKAPAGYRPVIVGDGLFGRAKRMGRYAMFVRTDATDADVRAMVEKMHRAQLSLTEAINEIDSPQQFPELFRKWSETYPDKDIIPFIAQYSAKMTEIKSVNRLKQNPTGFRTTPPVNVGRGFEDDAYVTEALTPYVTKWLEEGDVAARELFVSAAKHRLAGWSITGTRRTEKGHKSLEELYEGYKNLLADRPGDFQRGADNAVMTVDPNTMADINKLTNKVRRESNGARLAATRMARAQADWVLHNYSNTYDLDYLARWLGPWHIWPSRTVAKGLARVIDNPAYISGFSQLNNALEEVNNNDTIPDWAKHWISVDFLKGPASATLAGIGKDAELGLNPSAFLFYSGIFDNYDMGRDDETNTIGRMLNSMNNVGIPINPLIQWWAVGTGAYGKSFDRADYFESAFGRSTKQLLSLGDAAEIDKIFGSLYPRDIAITKRDKRGIALEYSRMIMEAEAAGDRAKVDKILKSAEKVGLSLIGKQSASMGGVLNPTLRDDDVFQEARSRYYGGLSLRSVSSMVGGQVRAFEPSIDEINDFVREYFDLVHNYKKSDRERDTFLREHPYVRAYLHSYQGTNSDEEYRFNQARNLWFQKKDELELAADAEYARTNVGDMEAQRDLAVKYAKERVNLAQELKDATGVDVLTDPRMLPKDRMTAKDTDIYGRSLLDQLGRATQEMIHAGKIILTEDEKKAMRAVDHADEMLKVVSNLGFTFPEAKAWIDWFYPATYTQLLEEQVANELRKGNFILEDEYGRDTNAIDMDAYLKTRSEIYNSLPKDVAKMLKQRRNRWLSPEEAVDEAILDIVNERAALVWEVRSDQKMTAKQKAEAEAKLFEGFKLPSVTEVMQIFEDNYGSPWYAESGKTQAEVRDVVGQRLAKTGDIGDLAKWMDGNWQRRVDVLETDLNAIDAATDPALKAELIKQRRDFSGPKGHVISTREALERFKKGLATAKLIDASRKQGLEGGFFADPSADSDYYHFFVQGGDSAAALQRQIDKYFANGQKDKAFELIGARDKIIGTIAPEADKASPTAVKPTTDTSTGIASAGKDPTKIGTKYNLQYVSPSAQISQAGKLTRNFLTSKYFSGQYANNAPGDWVFEHLARNGVAEQSEIEDFFYSVYNAVKGIMGPRLAANEEVQNLLFAIENEDKDEKTKKPKVAPFRYIKGIEGLLQVIYGVSPQASKATVAGNKGVSLTGIPPTKSDEKKLAKPSTAGVGGLPLWNEAVSYMNNIFGDKEFVISLIRHFQDSRRSPLSADHQRMLRYMYSSFPVGIDLSFEKYVQALKLMWQTEGVSMGGRTAVNPATNYGGTQNPKTAKFRAR